MAETPRRIGRLRVLVAALTTAWAAVAAAMPIEPGEPLAQALLSLRENGLRIVFADNVVTSDMRVDHPPRTSEPRDQLAEILAAHGLAAREGPGGVLVIVRLPSAAAVATGERPAATFAEEMFVSPSGVSMLREAPISLASMSRSEILALPHLGDDFFRSLTILPGATANDATAHFHLRGGWRDQTQVVLDGQEIYEAYHLADFDDASSVVASSSLGAADLLTAGFPARYGDRLAGVLDLQTRAASGRRRLWLGLGALSLEAGGSGGLPDGRGAWLVAARRGAIDLVARLIGDEDPSYADGFAKLDLAFGDRHTLRLDALATDDRLLFEQTVDGDFKHHDTRYRANYTWLTAGSLLGPALYVETSASASRADRRRQGTEIEEDAGFTIHDRRDFDVTELRQSWAWEASDRQSLAWGASWRRSTIGYDYASELEFDNPLALLRHDADQPGTALLREFRDLQQGVWIEQRARFGARWNWQGGLRYDSTTRTDERLWSPRATLAGALGERSVLRFAWGRYRQSQRVYELGVEDGETEFSPVERAEHRVLGFEHTWPREHGDLGLRVEAYQRRVPNPRPRYGNLFEVVNTFPEAEPDRVQFAPQSSRAEGAEILLRGAPRRWRWTASYTVARTRDRFDGRWAPRLFDERHAVKLDLDLPLGAWNLNLAWRFHTGWPTTALTTTVVEGDAGDIVWTPVLGSLNGKRLPAYHRLDLRASRSWRSRRAAWSLYFDVQNLYDRKNVAGFDIEIDPDSGAIDRVAERWAGILPSLGIRVEF